jgi:hypothetical protein
MSTFMIRPRWVAARRRSAVERRRDLDDLPDDGIIACAARERLRHS